MTELQTYISTTFGVHQDYLGELSSLFKQEKLSKGDFYLKPGSHTKKLSFVKSGYLRIYLQTENKEVTQWISSQGDFITDLRSFMFNQPSKWNIVALTDIELFTVNEENYDKINQIVPQWNELEKMFLGKCFLTLEERVFSFLSMSSEERYNFFFQYKPELFNTVPLQYLASMLGMTPETLSRIRSKSIS